MESDKKSRIQYLDTAKGIGILLVCIGHACTNRSVVTECRMLDMIRFVTLFHMVLFFFVNGMLYQTKYSERPVTGSIAKFRSYYIPFVKYNLLFWLLHNLFAKYYLISGELDEKDYAYEGVREYAVSFLKTLAGFRQRFAGAMWFLEALIVISIVFIFVDFVVTRVFPQKRIVMLTMSVSGIVLINRLLNLAEVSHVPGALTQMVYWGLNGLLFFYLGYLYRYFSWNEKLLKYKFWLTPLLLLIILFVTGNMKKYVISVVTNISVPIYRNVFDALAGEITEAGLPLLSYLFYVLIGFGGVVMVLLFSQFRRISELKVLKVLGKYSLHIMCLHLLAFKCVSYLIIKIYRMPTERLAEYPVIQEVDGLWWIAYAVCGCVLPVLAVKLFEIAKSKIVCLHRKREKA